MKSLVKLNVFLTVASVLAFSFVISADAKNIDNHGQYVSSQDDKNRAARTAISMPNYEGSTTDNIAD